MRFSFSTATEIIFGSGSASEIAPRAAAQGDRACVVTGKNPDRYSAIFDQLHSSRLQIINITVHDEPTVDSVLDAARKAQEQRCTVVIGIGGGSVLDTAKAVSALITNPGDIFDYLEVIGKGKKITQVPAPCITVPTTAGSGTEVTRNAVIISPEHKVKVSMRSPLMLPRCAIVDPLLTHSMSPALTACTGLDALTQLIEPFVGITANPLVDSLCREGMQRIARSLLAAFRNGSDVEAREDMLLASLFGGLALANAKLGAVHGIAGPLGGMLRAPHGVICARLLPGVIETNIKALRSRQSTSPALVRYGEIASILSGKPHRHAKDCISHIRRFCNQLKIPSLTEFGFSVQDIEPTVHAALKASSMKGNPILLTEEEISRILHELA